MERHLKPSLDSRADVEVDTPSHTNLHMSAQIMSDSRAQGRAHRTTLTRTWASKPCHSRMHMERASRTGSVFM
jgi:ribosomal protein L18